MTARQRSFHRGTGPVDAVVPSPAVDTDDGVAAPQGLNALVADGLQTLRRPPRVSGRDVAARAGVSTATVSLALGAHASRLKPAT